MTKATAQAGLRHVYATKAYEYLRDEMVTTPGFTAGNVVRKTFADGERGLRLAESVKGQHAIVVGGTHDDAATLDLFDLAFGLASYGVDTLSLVVPYFGYSTQERAAQPGEVVTAKSRALLLSALPRARLGTEVILVDLHTPGISHYFEDDLRTYHLSAQELALAVVRKIAIKEAVVIACTDAGRAKWVTGLANEAGLPAAFVYKARRADGGLEVTGVNADVQGKHVVIYDDMVRTGGSLLQAAAAYKKAGAARLTAVTTHGVLAGSSLDKIAGAELFEALYCTDSLPRVRDLAAAHPKFLRLMPLAPLIAAHFGA
jgi:ribose-phosphate pyrophosphokinase